MGRGLHAFHIAGENLAQRNELRAVRAREARIGHLQRRQRGLDVSGELQLLRGDGENLLDLGEHPFVAAARQILVERLERALMVLRFGELLLEQRELRLRVAHRLLRLPRSEARVAAVGLAVAHAAHDFLTQVAHLAAAVVPQPGENQREQAQSDRRGRGEPTPGRLGS